MVGLHGVCLKRPCQEDFGDDGWGPSSRKGLGEVLRGKPESAGGCGKRRVSLAGDNDGKGAAVVFLSGVTPLAKTDPIGPALAEHPVDR
jgi:hypothetical protein